MTAALARRRMGRDALERGDGMALWRMVGWGPGGVPRLGSQLRGRPPSLGPKTLQAAAAVAAAAPKAAAAAMFRGNARDSGCG